MAHTAWSNLANAAGRLAAADSHVHWVLAANLSPILLNKDGSLRLKEWLADGSANVFKSAPHRTIYRVQLKTLTQTIDFFLKQYLAVGPRNRLREVLRSTKAKSEFDKVTLLTQRGILVPRALGWGRLGHSFAPNASFLLSETVQDARHLTDVMADLSPRRRHQLAKSLGVYLARLHAAGVRHRDLHPGNLLIRWPPGAEPDIVLIDLHEAQIGKPLSWRRRRENLCVFNRYFILRSNRTDRARFWQAYAEVAGHNIPDHPTATPTKLEAATAMSNSQFWRARGKKYMHSSRFVERVTPKVIAVRGLDANFVARFRAHPDALFDDPNAQVLKQGGRSTVVRLPEGILKRFNVKSRWAELFKGFLRASQAERSWLFGQLLLDASLPTPRPMLYGVAGSNLPGAEYLLTEHLQDVCDLRQFVDRSANVAGHHRHVMMRERIRVVAGTIRKFHDRHFGHRDLKAGNLLTPVDPSDHRVWFIDLVGVRWRRRVSRKRRVCDLARLAASFLKHPGLTHGDRLRFLLAYFGAANHSNAGWKRWWRELAEAAQTKVDRTQSRGRPLG